MYGRRMYGPISKEQLIKCSDAQFFRWREAFGELSEEDKAYVLKKRRRLAFNSGVENTAMVIFWVPVTALALFLTVGLASLPWNAIELGRGAYTAYPDYGEGDPVRVAATEPTIELRPWACSVWIKIGLDKAFRCYSPETAEEREAREREALVERLKLEIIGAVATKCPTIETELETCIAHQIVDRL